MAYPGHRRAGAVWCLFWPDPWGSCRSGPPKNGAEALAVHAAVFPVDALLAADPLEQGAEELLPDAAALPLPQPPPTRNAGATAHLLGEHLPGDAAPQHEDDPGQASAVIDRRSAPL